jgi:hypothetical protein
MKNDCALRIADFVFGIVGEALTVFSTIGITQTKSVIRNPQSAIRNSQSTIRNSLLPEGVAA